MSAVASSYEVTHTPEMLAGEVNWRFNQIAMDLPSDVKLAPVGERILLAESRGIGRLEAAYAGSFMVCVEVDFEGYDELIGQDFPLAFGSLGGRVLPTENRAAAEDFMACDSTTLSDIALRLEKLHTCFVEAHQAEPAPVLSIVDGSRI